jgi:pimeloyl-ACP methyl ester carboxylesterase
VHLLGHSRGGPIALTVASQYPEVIRTVILEDGNIDSMMPETPKNKSVWLSGRCAPIAPEQHLWRATLHASNPTFFNETVLGFLKHH